MKDGIKGWGVEVVPTGPPEVGPQVVDRATGFVTQIERRPVDLRCTHPDKPGVEFYVEGWEVTTHRDPPRRRGDKTKAYREYTLAELSATRTPYAFEYGDQIRVKFPNGQTPQAANAANVKPLHNVVKRHYRQLATRWPEMWGRAKSLPSPGRRGLHDGHYAVWAKRYIDAVDSRGRGAVKWLLDSNPGMTAQNLERTTNKAEDLGLVEWERSPGKAKVGRMTETGLALLEQAEGYTP